MHGGINRPIALPLKRFSTPLIDTTLNRLLVPRLHKVVGEVTHRLGNVKVGA